MLIEDLVDDYFSGAVYVIKENEIILKKAYGYADRPNKIPNEIDTKFATASAGKVFVAVGILQLIEQGKLYFNSTIGDILNFDLKSIDKNITVKQLLCHTSGIPDYFDETIMRDYQDLWVDYPNYKIRKSSDLIPLFIDKPMIYPAGEKFQYNNTGFVVLGLIIEKITGLLFDEYLKDNIFIPCQMLDTGYYELDRLPAKCANAYCYDSEKNDYFTNIYSVDVKGTGAGGAFTTILDVIKFWECLLGEKLISKNMLEQMLSVQAGNDKEYCGYDIWLEKSTDGVTYIPYFQGCDPGISFISSYDIKNNVIVTVASNNCNNVWKLRRNIIKVIQN